MLSEARLKPAATDDIVAVAALFARSRAAALPFLPILHTPDEDRAYFGGWLRRGVMTLAIDEAELLGFMVESDGWIEHLYLDPSRRRQGVGSLLVRAAQSRQQKLSLWCFARNDAALAFYRHLGFVEQRRTDGDNEERQPDVLLAWRRG